MMKHCLYLLCLLYFSCFPTQEAIAGIREPQNAEFPLIQESGAILFGDTTISFQQSEDHSIASPYQPVTESFETNLDTSPPAETANVPIANTAPAEHYHEIYNDPEHWHVDITPYAWLPSSNGTTTIRGITRETDMKFSDLLEEFQFGGFARTEAWKNDWGFILDASYSELGSENTGPHGQINIDSEFKQLVVDTAISRRFRINMNDCCTKQLFIEPIAGIRNTYVKTGLSLTPGPDLSGDIYWMDLFVGGRITVPLSWKWLFAVRGDIGGFGIGESAHCTWNLLAGFDYQPRQHWSFKIGYKLSGLDYSKGQGRSAIGTDTFYYGPWLGLTYHF